LPCDGRNGVAPDESRHAEQQRHRRPLSSSEAGVRRRKEVFPPKLIREEERSINGIMFSGV
jgi:hypothetical protein